MRRVPPPLAHRTLISPQTRPPIPLGTPPPPDNLLRAGPRALPPRAEQNARPRSPAPSVRPTSSPDARLAEVLIASRGIFGVAAPGSCLAYAPGPDPAQFQPLDAGPSLNLAGPGGSRQLIRRADGSYTAAEASGYFRPGAYSIDNGAGGADVG